MNYQYKHNGRWFDESTGPYNFVKLPDGMKRCINAGRPVVEVGFKNLKWRVKQVVWQYYYATSKVEEECWHDEGTAPFPHVKYDAMNVSRHGCNIKPLACGPNDTRPLNLYWRERPADPSGEVDPVVCSEFPTDGCDEPPTAKDADKNGLVQVLTNQGWELYHWSQQPTNWRHTLNWKEPLTTSECIDAGIAALRELEGYVNLSDRTSKNILESIDEALTLAKGELRC